MKEAKGLTHQFPRSARAWSVRGLCETRAARFEEAVASFRHAHVLGIKDGLSTLRKAEERARIAAMPHGQGKVIGLLDEGGGYWLVAVGVRGLDGEQSLLERQPSGGNDRVLFRARETNAGSLGLSFGLRRLDDDAHPELVVESYSWLSNGGECELGILSGSRGRWRVRLQEPNRLWDVPVVGPDRNGRYELGIRNWVWYKGPTWTDLCRWRRGRLVDVTRRHPDLIRRQAQLVRKAVREDLRSRHDDRIVDAQKALRRYGLHL